jgi:LCP family protein required for cell wall assembly
MRTTLKRGIGRGAAFDGNGRAVLPPGVIRPMTVYRQPLPNPRRGWAVAGRIVLWSVAASLMLIGGFAGGNYLYLERDIAEKLTATSPDLKAAQEKLDVVVPGEPTVALVLGYDKRKGREAAQTGHSDTLMLVRADPEQKTISMLSFPRDLLVDIHCGGGRIFGGRINTAYAVCGARGALFTVRELTDVPINYLVTVDFRGFKQIVAKLGGVWMDVDRRYFNDRGGPFGYATIDLKPGYQKLNGQKALDFVRYRHTDSDLYRVVRQQTFVRAMRQRLADFPLVDLPKLVNTVTENVEVGKSGASEWSARTVLGYALLAYKLEPGHVFQAKLDPARLVGYSELSTDETNIREAVQEFLNPDVGAAEKATASALGRKIRRPTGPPASEVPVTVLNGNGVQGSASRAAYELQQRGYPIIFPPNGAPANAPNWSYFATTIYYDPQQPSARAAALRMANLFGNGKVTRVTPAIAALGNGAMLVTVVGQTFHGTLAPAPIDRTPERQPPVVQRDPAATQPLLKQARRRVPFQLQVPTVLERSSYPATVMPMRVYNLENHKAVRLTFSTGASEYWGIEQTDWEDAPVLDRPNDELRIKGREFHLYYSGPHLHMVVLRENGATYWVVNTLLDSLSNETMLAIAKGFRPLRA